MVSKNRERQHKACKENQEGLWVGERIHTGKQGEKLEETFPTELPHTVPMRQGGGLSGPALSLAVCAPGPRRCSVQLSFSSLWGLCYVSLLSDDRFMLSLLFGTTVCLHLTSLWLWARWASVSCCCAYACSTFQTSWYQSQWLSSFSLLEPGDIFTDLTPSLNLWNDFHKLWQYIFHLADCESTKGVLGKQNVIITRNICI